ncbi:hypothetical protein LXL04_018285 [Taraxacum kok-saghyz]
MATLLRRFVRTEDEPATARNLRSITGLHRLQFRRYPAKPAKSSDSAFSSDDTLRNMRSITGLHRGATEIGLHRREASPALLRSRS